MSDYKKDALGLPEDEMKVVDIHTPADVEDVGFDSFEENYQVQIPRQMVDTRSKIGYVIGADIVTPFGFLEETFEAMLKSESAARLLTTKDIWSLKDKPRISNFISKNISQIIYDELNRLNQEKIDLLEILPDDEKHILENNLDSNALIILRDKKLEERVRNNVSLKNLLDTFNPLILDDFFETDEYLDKEQQTLKEENPDALFFKVGLTSKDFDIIEVPEIKKALLTKWKDFVKSDREAMFVDQFPTRIGAPIPEEFMQKMKASLPPKIKKGTKEAPAIWYAYVIAYQMLEAAGMLDENGVINPEFQNQTSVIFGTGLGGLITNEKGAIYGEKGTKPKLSHSPSSFMPSALPSMVASWLAVYLKAKCPSLAPNGACATGIMALYEAMLLIRSGRINFAISGGSEEALHSINGIKGFGLMKATSSRNSEPQKSSNPFGLGHDGFLMGEGGGSVLIASEEGLDQLREINLNTKVLCDVIGVGGSNCTPEDSITEGTVEGQSAAIQDVLTDAGFAPNDIDLVISHGTSTPIGDKVEADTLKNVFGDKLPLIWCPKAAGDIGHSLGAAGAISVALGVKIFQEGIIPGIANKDYQPDPELNIPIIQENTEFTGKYILVCAWGFGGINYTAILKRHEADIQTRSSTETIH